jgi:hypothetical protein
MFLFWKKSLYKIERICFNVGMEEQEQTQVPSHCPVCGQDLIVTRLECGSCGTEVTGNFTLGRVAMLHEPHASLIEMFLRARGNVKEMERELGLSYPTVRARLDEAFNAAGFPRSGDPDGEPLGDVDLGEAIRARVEDALNKVHLEDRIRAHVDRGLAEVHRAQAEVHRAQSGLDQARSRAERHRREDTTATVRKEILDQLDRGDITAEQAMALLRELKDRRP